MNADAGTVEIKVKALDDYNGEPIAFSELREFNPWPSTLISASVQGVVIALVLIGAKLMGVL